MNVTNDCYICHYVIGAPFAKILMYLYALMHIFVDDIGEGYDGISS